MSVTKILLVIPPGLPGTTPNREGAAGLGAVQLCQDGFRYPPHTVAVAAAVLRENGFATQIIDGTMSSCSAEALATRVAGAKPDLVAIFVSWATRHADEAFVSGMAGKVAGKVPLVAFGVSSSVMIEHLRAADCVLTGEPELALPTLCQRLCDGDATLPKVVGPATIGVAGYDEHGLLSDLDALPVPAWDLTLAARYPCLTVLSSRGCTACCSWCPYVVAQGRAYRSCTPERTVAELREIVRRYHPQRVIFRDPVFAHDPNRVEAICSLILRDSILRPGKNLRWECESRPDHFAPALLRLMSLAGCTAVKVGLETASHSLLASTGRLLVDEDPGEYLEAVKAMVRTCTRYGIASRLFVLVGLPGQSLDDVRRTARFLRDVGPSSISIKPLIRYPGVRLEPGDDAEIASQAAVLEEVRGALPARSGLASRWLVRLRRGWAKIVFHLRDRLCARS